MKAEIKRTTVIKTCILIIFAFLFSTPLLWMISSSLKSVSEVYAAKFTFFGESIRWENYKAVWVDSAVTMYKAFLNTFKIVIISIVGQLSIASLAAYGFAKIKFKGKDLVFILFLASMMIPTQVTIIPRFMMFKTMGLYNTHWSIILPNLFSATAIFMLRQFYMGLPDALVEAAKIDGAGHLRIFSQILMPLTKPAMVTLMVLAFVATWNEYLSPLVFLTHEELFTVSQNIRWYLLSEESNDHLTMAAATSAILPVVILFISCQKYFIEGIASSGVKG